MMNSRFLQAVVMIALLPIVGYALVGRVLGAQSPGGKLSWTGRRWRNGFTVLLSSWCGGILILMVARSAPMALTVGLSALLGCGLILAARWLWRDWKKEQQARDAYLENLAQEGKAYTAPQLTGTNKAWRFGFNAYALVLILALIYGLIRYLVKKY